MCDSKLKSVGIIVLHIDWVLKRKEKRKVDKYCVSKYAYMRTHPSSMHMCTSIGAERLDHFKKCRPS